MKNILAGFLLFLPLLANAATNEPPSCDDWTLNDTWDWVGCEWDGVQFSGANAIDEFVAETYEEKKELAIDSAKSYIASLALDYIVNNFQAAGQIAALFGDTQGPSEIELAVEEILKAIKISETRIIERVNAIFIARDFAGLSAFKLRVSSYMLSSHTVQVNNVAELQNLWTTAVELRNVFETHTTAVGVQNSIPSYHAYIGIVGLELILRAQLTTFDYQISGEEHLIEPMLRNHYDLELKGVFAYIDSIDWHGAAVDSVKFNIINDSYDETLTNGVEKEGSIGSWYNSSLWIGRVGACPAIHGYLDFRYLDQNYSFTSVCSHNTGNCYGNIQKGNMRYFDDGSYFQELFLESGPESDNANNANLRFTTNTQACDLGTPYNPDSTNHTGKLHADNMLEGVIKSIEEEIIRAAYKPTVRILDSWWKLAGNTSPRPLNAADISLEQQATYYDTDGDGLVDLFEVTIGTLPNSIDTDTDTINDGYEVNYGLDPLDINDAGYDKDLDGLTNLQEYQYGTNPIVVDTDRDKISDFDEIMQGSNPLLNIQNSLIIRNNILF